MVASEVEIPFYRCVGRQRGRGFGALAQNIGRTAIPFLRKYIVPAAKRVAADLLKFAVPEIAEVVIGRKNFNTAAKSVGRQTLRKQLGEESRRRTGSSRKRSSSRVNSNTICKTNQSIADRHFYKHFSLIMSSNFRYQPLVAVSGNLGGKIPVVDDVLSFLEQKIYPTTSLDENCIEFEFQTDRNCYVDLRQTYLALKLKIVRGRGYETYNTKEVKKEHKEEAKAEEEETAEEDAPVPLITHVSNSLHSISSNVEVYINNQQIYNSNGSYAHKSYISNNFRGAISEYKGVLHCEGYDYEEFPDEIMEALSSEPIFTRRMKLLSRPDGSMLYDKLGVDFFSTSELLYPNLKISLRLIRARPNFYMISDNPTSVLELLIVHFTLVVLLSRMIIRRPEWTCLLTFLWSSFIWEFLQRLLSFRPDKTNSFKKTFSTMLQFVGLPLQLIQTLHSLDLILKIHSGINNLSSDNLEYSEEVSQL